MRVWIAAVFGLALTLVGCGSGLKTANSAAQALQGQKSQWDGNWIQFYSRSLSADLIIDGNNITLTQPWFGGVEQKNGAALLQKEVRTGTVQVEILSTTSKTPDGSPYLSGRVHIHITQSSCAGIHPETADLTQDFAIAGPPNGSDTLYWGDGTSGNPLYFLQRLTQPLPRKVDDGPTPLPVSSLAVGCYHKGKFIPTGGPQP